MSLRPASPLRIALIIAGGSVLLGICAIVGLRLLASRTLEFRAQAQAGQAIVRAVEDFRKQTGGYPASLADLSPKYLPTILDLPDESQNKFKGWEYRVVTNGLAVSYTLRYYMGRGGVEYEPPNWVGNDEGHKAIILKND